MSERTERGTDKWVHVQYVVPVTDVVDADENEVQKTAVNNISDGTVDPVHIDVTDTDEWPDDA